MTQRPRKEQGLQCGPLDALRRKLEHTFECPPDRGTCRSRGAGVSSGIMG